MSTSRKIYIVVLFIFLLMLIWDKTVRCPSVTEPLATFARNQAAPQPEVSFNNSTSNLRSSPNLAVYPDREFHNFSFLPLGTLSPQLKPGETRNLFAASDEFNRLAREKSQKAAPSRKEVIALSLKLSGILIGDKNSCVLINGEVVFLGQYIGPYRLVEINPDSVVLEADSQCITLLWDGKKISN